MNALLVALPWLLLLAWIRFGTRVPSELPEVEIDEGSEESAPDAPLVSVIVPARNEAPNIETCVRSLAASTYPAFEIIVMDDRSEDDTAARAAAISPGNARRIVVLEGGELPEGWLGKPWACHQGAAEARGSLLLFTDADTTHAPDLLTRAVAGLQEERADLLTVIGRQLMETFWERLVQPQIFMMMLIRFRDFEAIAKSRRWRDAIANGQYLLFTREAYEAVGGHEVVRDEVVEDLALAQVVKREGRALRIRGAYDGLATRMYRSLPELVGGWSKNIYLGGLQSLPPVLRPVAAPLSLVAGIVLWILPAALLVLGLAGAVGPLATRWAAIVTVASAGTFSWFSAEMGAPARYGLLYPLGALVGLYVFARSWVRGRTVEWKGRRYRVPSVGERP